MRAIKPLVLCVLLLPAFAATTPAQCVIGVYADAEGATGSFAGIPPFTLADIYVVMHVESTVAGVAYTIQFPTLNFVVGVAGYGPSGSGLNVPGAGGDNIGLGECAIGFNAYPVLVAHYTIYHTNYLGLGMVIQLGPNTDEDPMYPVYADCADNLVTCPNTSALYLNGVGTEDKSIGAVKALYGS